MRRAASMRPLAVRLSVAAVTAGWLSVGWGGAPHAPPAAAAAVEHRAAVIIDTGTEVKSVCVRFQEASITGVELLARAYVDPVFHAFAGKGAAVCSLCGVGCPAGESCLTCNAEGQFWSYSRAPAGAASLRTSGVGASSTVVHDGDVEGWRWGLGGTPPFATVEQVCGEALPQVTTTAASTVVTTTAAAGAATTSPVAPATPGTTTTRPAATATTRATTAPPGSAPAVAEPGVTTGGRPAAGEAEDTATTAASGLAATRTSSGRTDGGSSWPGLVVFGLMVAGLVTWGSLVRRRRRTPA